MAVRSSITKLSAWQQSFARATFASSSRSFNAAPDQSLSDLPTSPPGSAADRNRAAFEDLLDAVREPGRPDGVDGTEAEFQRLLEGTRGDGAAGRRNSKVPDWLTTPARMAPSFTQFPRSPPVRRFKGTTSPRRRGQGMTPHEGAVFNEVLDAIWRDLEASGVSKDRGRVSPYGPMMSGKVRERQVVGVGAGLDASQKDLLQEMDRLKEEMSSLQTDVDLLDWAKRRVFTPEPSPTSADESGANVEATDIDEVVNYPATYPHVLAHLLQVSRNTFQNPHMALSLFHHARTLSLDSYLQGCLTPAYNEALTTRWESFRDIDGVEQGIREMELHGVGWDRGTCNLISQIVEQVSKDVLNRAGHWSDATISRMRKLEEAVERDVKRQERHWAMTNQQERRGR